MDAIDKLIAQSVTQNTDLWDKARLGKFTASEIHKLISAKGELTQTALTYIMEKVAEELTGEAPEISTFAMQWGHEYEPYARRSFAIKTGLELQSVGFIPYTDHSGGSPDDLVPATKGVVDYKCPANSVNHIKHLLIDSPEYFKANHKEYYYQLQANMLFAKCNRAYFVSYDHRVKEYPLFVFEMEANIADQSVIDKAIERATAYKLELLDKLSKR